MDEHTVDEQSVDQHTVDEHTVDEQRASGVRERSGWVARLTSEPEAGMSTAEYAVGTVAACAFAAVLYEVVTGGSVVTALTGLVADALATLS